MIYRFTDSDYADLRTAARGLVARDFRGERLQPEALVHEVWLRLAGRTGWESPGHFRAVATRAMRRILIDRWRQRRVHAQSTPLAAYRAEEPCGLVGAGESATEDVREILERLGKVHAGTAIVVRMKFFEGMTDFEIAESLDCSPRTVRRQWAFARLWLRDRLRETTPFSAGNPKKLGNSRFGFRYLNCKVKTGEKVY